jgi:hypothetical protein
MMKRSASALLLSTILIMTFASSCRALRPPDSCGLGSFVNNTAYGLYIDDLDLLDVNGKTGELDRDGAPRFEEGQTINLWLQVKSNIRIRICVEETRGGGEIAFDETASFPSGQSAVTFGVLERGPYVIRISIDGTLVQNIPFSVR